MIIDLSHRSDSDLNIIRKMAESKDITIETLVIQALRMYQMHDKRLADGETCAYSGDYNRARQFYHHPEEYDVWIEGHSCTGSSNTATFLGTYSGENFEEAALYACTAFFNPYEPAFYYVDSEGTSSYWGCRLFDNEVEARKSFG